jgi:hypothetical protein
VSATVHGRTRFGFVPIAALALASALLVGCANVPAEEGTRVRCGWFDNPSPQNVTLTDRDGTWTVSEQGGHAAAGDWPVFATRDWVASGVGSYGYGCACLTVVDDAVERRVVEIVSARPRSLATCRRDPALVEPSDSR